MREFKFRAWFSNTNEMRYNFEDWMFYHQGKCKLMQWTGLKDKNGKDIYEGDIVKFEYTKDVRDFERTFKCVSEVKFAGGSFDVINNSGWQHEELSSVQNVEVIGNIFQNPELLKEE